MHSRTKGASGHVSALRTKKNVGLGVFGLTEGLSTSIARQPRGRLFRAGTLARASRRRGLTEHASAIDLKEPVRTSWARCTASPHVGALARAEAPASGDASAAATGTVRGVSSRAPWLAMAVLANISASIQCVAARAVKSGVE